ncbi:MAG: hypothetical protein GY710_22285 [Desulfobacteraceae bacterium]|nr:hypothetical protein [Desulfobacteraceae bacterium]
MFHIKIDQEKNRIYIKFGTIETGDGEQIFKQLQTKLNLLTPGFAGISDISTFKMNNPDEAIWVGKIFTLLTKAEMGISARVTGVKGKSKKVTGRHGHPVVVVETLAKANRILDQLQKHS